VDEYFLRQRRRLNISAAAAPAIIRRLDRRGARLCEQGVKELTKGRIPILSPVAPGSE